MQKPKEKKKKQAGGIKSHHSVAEPRESMLIVFRQLSQGQHNI
jgi:hypothetical protein